MGPDEYTAEKLLQIKNETSLLVFLTTIWLGRHVMIAWDRLNGGIIQIWGAEDLTADEVENLNNLIWQFLDHHKEEFKEKI